MFWLIIFVITVFEIIFSQQFEFGEKIYIHDTHGVFTGTITDKKFRLFTTYTVHTNYGTFDINIFDWLTGKITKNYD